MSLSTGRTCYLLKVPRISFFKYHHDQRSQHGRSRQTSTTQLPSLFSLARTRVYTQHQEENVERGQNVKDLENKVPHAVDGAKDVEVASDEDERVQALRDEGYSWMEDQPDMSMLNVLQGSYWHVVFARRTFGRLVGVNSPYQDALG